MTGNDTAFASGQRVYHRQRHQYGTYVEPSWTSGESIVDFGDDDVLRITTAQLVPADQVEEND
jgi:hypothetical protein